MRTATAHAILRLRETDPRLADKIHPATADGLLWCKYDWSSREIRLRIGWHLWKRTGAHQLGLFGERRGPRAGVPWHRKTQPFLRVCFLAGARCATEPAASPGSADRQDIAWDAIGGAAS